MATQEGTQTLAWQSGLAPLLREHFRERRRVREEAPTGAPASLLSIASALMRAAVHHRLGKARWTGRLGNFRFWNQLDVHLDENPGLQLLGQRLLEPIRLGGRTDHAGAD